MGVFNVPINLKVGDIIQTKKPHPCGNNEWEILRTGADFRIKCTNCERQIWISRINLEKSIKKIVKSDTATM